MATVFKRQDKGNWIVQWYDHTGKRRERSSRTTDKRSAQRIAGDYEAKAALRREGVVDPADDRLAEQNRTKRGLADPRAFALRVTDESMLPRYEEGELAVCSPETFDQDGFKDGSRYAILFRNGNSTIKRVRLLDGDEMDLIPENERYTVRRISQADIACAARVVARVSHE